MKSSQVRQKFIDFFIKKGHKQVKFNSAYLWRDVNVEQITKYLYNYNGKKIW